MTGLGIEIALGLVLGALLLACIAGVLLAVHDREWGTGVRWFVPLFVFFAVDIFIR